MIPASSSWPSTMDWTGFPVPQSISCGTPLMPPGMASRCHVTVSSKVSPVPFNADPELEFKSVQRSHSVVRRNWLFKSRLTHPGGEVRSLDRADHNHAGVRLQLCQFFNKATKGPNISFGKLSLQNSPNTLSKTNGRQPDVCPKSHRSELRIQVRLSGSAVRTPGDPRLFVPGPRRQHNHLGALLTTSNASDQLPTADPTPP